MKINDELLSWILLSICLILLFILLFKFAFSKCVETEDLCFRSDLICSKGCVKIDKPVSCSDSRVTGHREFCSRREWIWNLK